MEIFGKEALAALIHKIKEVFATKKDVNNLEEVIKGQKEYIDNKFLDLDTNGYEYVDMGEAGIWAKYPIGVTDWNTCYDDVLYFQWGGIQGYTAQQVRDGEKDFSRVFTDYRFSGEGAGVSNPQLTKYCSKAQYGKDKTFTDDLTVLEPEDDAAHVNMGGLWRMPVKEEFQKLKDLCDVENVTDYNGISGLNGCLFKLKSDNSKQLFVPAAGDCDSSKVYSVGSYGSFWSASLYETHPGSGFYLSFVSGSVSPQSDTFRGLGLCVIGFLDKSTEKYLTKKEAKETYATKEDLENIDIPEVDLSNIEATKLKTPVTIWGQEFDGSGNVSGRIKSSAQATTADISKIPTENEILLESGDGTPVGGTVWIWRNNWPTENYGIFYNDATDKYQFILGKEQLSITKTGVGIGGVSSPTERLHVNGSILATGNISSTNITAIESYIPSKASATNQLVTENELDVVKTLAESVNQGLGETIQRVETLESSLQADKTNLANFKAHVEADFIKDVDYNNDKATIMGQIMSKEDAMKIVPVTGTSLKAEFGCYYRLDDVMGGFNLALPQVRNDSTVKGFILNFTTGDMPALLIATTADVRVSYFKGYSIEPNTTYELNFMYNGDKWIVAHGTIN